MDSFDCSRKRKTLNRMKEVKSLDWKVLSRIIAMTKPIRALFYSTIFLAIILAPISVVRPYIVKEMIDVNILNNDMVGLRFTAMIYIGFVLLNVVLRYFFIYSTALVGNSVVKDFRVQVFRHLSSLHLSFFDKTPVGTATTRTINDIEAVNTTFSQGIITIVADVLSIFAILAIMFYTSWRLAIICILIMPPLILATYIFKEKVKSAYQVVRNQISKMNAFLQERITGMRVVQIFNAEDQEMKKFKAINREYTQANLNSIFYYAIFFPVVELITAVSLALLVWWGARSYVEGAVSFGALVAFPMYLSMLVRPMRMLADKFNTLQMGLVAADRVFKLLDNSAFIKNEGKLNIDRFEGNIRFDKVDFSYDGENKVIHDLSFEIKPGETLAIVGSTGSGKTTIINILNRFYEIQDGSIQIDGKDIRDIELNNLRQRISMVLQDVFLFNGTVLENITLKDDSISKEQVIEAAKMIGAHRYIQDMPDTYDFMVMERGGNLSMGQRQLISFVRALVCDPDILILDEATSSIDTETEAVIQFAIEKLITKRTSIIIAHRLSTIRHADKILVMEEGRKKELGTHEELLALENGRYKELYEMQFAEVLNEAS